MNKILCITIVLTLIGVESVLARNDILEEIGFFGYYGDWGPWQFCPMGSYAAGYSLKSESFQKGGDDTAINGIRLLCLNKNRQKTGYITSSVGRYGHWKGTATCPFDTLVEVFIDLTPPQGDGDDMGVLRLRFRCHDGTVISAQGPNIPFGWGPQFPPYHWEQSVQFSCHTNLFNGQYVKTSICGIQTRVEGPQGSGDDTGLTSVRFKCCASP